MVISVINPANPQQTVFHWYEMCDAVFVLPLYFTGGDELGGRNDFLGRTDNGKTLQSFAVNPGGYVGFFNPSTNAHETSMLKDDKWAARDAGSGPRRVGASPRCRPAGSGRARGNRRRIERRRSPCDRSSPLHCC